MVNGRQSAVLGFKSMFEDWGAGYAVPVSGVCNDFTAKALSFVLLGLRLRSA
jgi:hypothetical protein